MVSSPTKIRILIADDHPLIRHALRNILETQHDFEIIGEASTGEMAVKLVQDLNPSIVILDISMPNMDGLEVTKQLKSKYPEIGILVLTIHDEDEIILNLLEAGADGYLVKSVFGDEVINAVRSVNIGENVLSPVIFKRILRYSFKNRIKPVPINFGCKLTAREIELIKLVAKGLANKDIAVKTGLSLRGVKSHLVNIYSKLNAKSRAESVVISLRMGIINLDDIEC